MRTLFWMICWMSGWAAQAQTTTYYPFPTDDADWSVEYGVYGFVGYSCLYTHHFGMRGDTTIGGNLYSKVYINQQDTFFDLSNASYFCALREDSSKRVWAYRPVDTTEVILYDFGLGDADTFCFDFFNGVCNTVSYIDSLLVNGVYRRQTNIFAQADTEQWVEGIGNVRSGLFEIQYIGNMTSRLRCYSEEGIVLYNPEGNCHCGVVSNVDPVETPESGFFLYPSPAQVQLMVEWNGEEFAADEGTLYIFNALGQLSYQQTITMGKTLIDVGDWKSGMYVALIVTGEGVMWTNRFIKD